MTPSMPLTRPSVTDGEWMDLPFAAMYAGVVPAVLSAAIRAGELPSSAAWGNVSAVLVHSQSVETWAAEREARLDRASPAEPYCRLSPYCGVVCSTSLSLAAAAHTICACNRPGWRLNRSIGPETETAATIRPAGPRTGADTEATPASRSPTDCDHPRRRTADKAVAVKRASRRPRCSRSGSSQASSIWAADPAFIVSVAPTGTVSRSPVSRSAAATQTPAVSLPAIELRALTGDVAQPREDRPGRLEQAVLAGGRGELAQPGTEDEAALQVARHEPVVLQGGGEAVSCGAGQPGGRDEGGQAGGAGFQGPENDRRLVEDADSARVVHALILPSHWLRRKSRSDISMARTLAEKVWAAHVVRQVIRRSAAS